MPLRLAALTALTTALLSGTAFAQTDTVAMARAAAANQLGVLEFCQDRGDVGPDAVTAERSVIARLPASTVNTDADEALGKQGTIAGPNGAKMTLDSMASTHGTSISAMCKQLGSGAIQSASAYQQNGMAPGGMAMPKMPSGMTMPAMPNGMTMPTAPGTQPQ